MEEPFSAQKTIDWLNKQWKGEKRCPICGHNSWNIGAKLLEVREYNILGAGIGWTPGDVYALSVVTCVTCGYTMFFNAVIADLAASINKDDTSKTETQPASFDKEDKIGSVQ